MKARTFGALLLAFAIAACGGKSDSGPEKEKAKACEQSDDCPEGQVCLARKCAKTSEGAVYTDPGNAVTPTKVKQEVERQDQLNRDRVDKAMGAE